MKWETAGIEQGTQGTYAEHAASHVMTSPKSLPVVVPVFPIVQTPTEYGLRVDSSAADHTEGLLPHLRVTSNLQMHKEQARVADVGGALPVSQTLYAKAEQGADLFVQVSSEGWSIEEDTLTTEAA
jgi:uncharacterized protein (DUF2345 family)